MRTSYDRRWGLLEDSRAPLLDALARLGVVQVRFVGAFPELDSVGVWLVTTTDRERDDLDLTVAGERVRQILRCVGFTHDELTDLGVVAESEETVERDFKGSWFYAMR